VPKSRKRKGAKKYTSRSIKKNATGEIDEVPVAKNGFFDLLYAEDAKIFKQLISYFPLISGSCLASSLRLEHGETFLLLMSVIFYQHYLDLITQGKLSQFRNKKTLFSLHVLAAGIIISFFLLTRAPLATVLLVFYCILALCRSVTEVANTRTLLFTLTALTLEMLLLAILGAFSQAQVIFLPVALVGFVPATYLIAAEIARHAEIFELTGWRRTQAIEKGEAKVVRPAGLTRLFSLFLVIGPLVPIALAPLNLLPVSFLLCALTIYFLPSLGTSFLERLQSNRLIALRCIHLAFLASILSLIAGLLAQF